MKVSVFQDNFVSKFQKRDQGEVSTSLSAALVAASQCRDGRPFGHLNLQRTRTSLASSEQLLTSLLWW